MTAAFMPAGAGPWMCALLAAEDRPVKLPCTDTAPVLGFRMTVAEPEAVEAVWEEVSTSIAPVRLTLYMMFAWPPAPPALPALPPAAPPVAAPPAPPVAWPPAPPGAWPPAPPVAEPPWPPAEPACPPAAEPAEPPTP